MLIPYANCRGRKFKREKLEKLKKPICCQKKSIIYNYNLLEKNKISFITQLFRWFNKDSRKYRIKYFLKKKYIISDYDLINLSVKIQKAGWKKLLLKLNYHLKDYKILKRRSYSLNFKFFFINIDDIKNKEMTLDIKAKNFDIFEIFITINGYYIDEFYNIINRLNYMASIKKDINDHILEDLDHVFSWKRLDKVICYDAYMPWYLSKENYCAQKQYKRKYERKYRCFIKEKKFNSIFPLKNVIGHVIVADRTDVNEDHIYWKTLLKKNMFKKKEDLFKELKLLIKIINYIFNANSILVYFFIKLVDE